MLLRDISCLSPPRDQQKKSRQNLQRVKKNDVAHREKPSVQLLYVKMPSTSNKTAAVAASMLTSLAAAIVYNSQQPLLPGLLLCCFFFFFSEQLCKSNQKLCLLKVDKTDERDIRAGKLSGPATVQS